jgi:hypothetical protein
VFGICEFECHVIAIELPLSNVVFCRNSKRAILREVIIF